MKPQNIVDLLKDLADVFEKHGGSMRLCEDEGGDCNAFFIKADMYITGYDRLVCVGYSDTLTHDMLRKTIADLEQGPWGGEVPFPCKIPPSLAI